HLQGANLSDAQLAGIDLTGAQLQGANLSGAHLDGAKLDGANLEGANLSRAVLNGATLTGANMKAVLLLEAVVHNANFADADADLADIRGVNNESDIQLKIDGGATPRLIRCDSGQAQTLHWSDDDNRTFVGRVTQHLLDLACR